MNDSHSFLTALLTLAYFGLSYILVLLSSWGEFAAIFGAITLKLARATISPTAVWYEWGLLGALAGAIAFPFLFPWL